MHANAVTGGARPSPAIVTVLTATATVAATAFALAYGGSKGAAVDAGMSAGLAGWYPLCVEGVLVVAGTATVVMGGWYPWCVLVAFTLLSAAANVLHALDHPGHHMWAPAVAAVPPLALPICVELAMRVGRRVRPVDVPNDQPVAATKPEQSTEPAQPPTPRGGGESGRLTLVDTRPVPREFPAACHCTTAGCSGQRVSKATWHRHNPSPRKVAVG